jgi:hypothetical protein
VTTVYVATDGEEVLGVYTTKEAATARCDGWIDAAVEKRAWHSRDGARQRSYRLEDGSLWATMKVTACEVEP